jgi:hypothetical protein
MLAGVAEHPLDDFQVGVGGQREGGGAVGQVVQPDRRQAEVLADLPDGRPVTCRRIMRRPLDRYPLAAKAPHVSVNINIGWCYESSVPSA